MQNSENISPNKSSEETGFVISPKFVWAESRHSATNSKELLSLSKNTDSSRESRAFSKQSMCLLLDNAGISTPG